MYSFRNPIILTGITVQFPKKVRKFTGREQYWVFGCTHNSHYRFVLKAKRNKKAK
jgi:hypothetical protein